MCSFRRLKGLQFVCCCLFVFLLGRTSADAQMVYQQRDVTTPDPQGFLTAASTATCVDGTGNTIADKSVPDGGFVKKFTTLRADASATLTGACDWYQSDGTFYRTELRNIASVKVYQYPPTLLASFQNIYPYSSTQSMDSRVSGTTSGSVSASHSELGSYRYTFTTNAYSTNCTITPTASSIVEKTVNVVACTPKWWIVAYSPPRTLHLPATTISVYVPSSMSDLYTPTDDAISAWNGLLSGTGVTLDRVTSPCGTNGSCVNVAEGSVSSGCAESSPGNTNSAGEFTTESTITLPTSWQTRSSDRNKRTVAHELGHLLGLNHNDCSTSDSVMSIAPDCSTTAGLALTPTTTDTLPVTSSTYGNNVQKICRP